jgi:hypothetical protein
MRSGILCPGCGSSQDGLGEPRVPSYVGRVYWEISVLVFSCNGVTCNSYKAAGPKRVEDSGSVTPLVDGTFVGWERRIDRLFLPKPNLAPIRFQLFPERRCRLFGGALNVNSEVGGVVGGVMGSAPGVVLELLLASVARSISMGSEAEPDADLLATGLLRPRSRGRKDVFGDCEPSSDEVSKSLGIRSLDLLFLSSTTSSVYVSP